jgi:hypothetical protein
VTRCQECGAENAEGNRFCGSCGKELSPVVTPPTAVSPAVPPITAPVAAPGEPPGPPPASPPAAAVAAAEANPPATTPVIPPPMPYGTTPARPAFTMPEIDLTKVLTGDWKGAALVALATFGTAAVLSVALVGLMHPNDASFTQFATAATLVLCSAFGADFVATSNADNVEASFGAYPLTVTLAALCLGAFLFWRQASRLTSLFSAAMHAVRTSLVFTILLCIPAVIFRGPLRMPAGFDLGTFTLSGDFGVRIPSLIFLSFLFMLLTTLVTLLKRREWLPKHVVGVRDWMVAPFAGLVAMVLSCCVVGLVIAIAVVLIDEDSRGATALVELAATVPNLGILGVLIGGGVGYQVQTTGSDATFASNEVHHLTYAADHASQWVWLLPIATVAVVLIGAVWTVRRSSSVKAATTNLLYWMVMTTIAFPILAHLSGAHAHARETSGRNPASADVFIGVVTWQVILLSLFASFVAAVIVATVVRSRSEVTAPAPPTPGWAPPT